MNVEIFATYIGYGVLGGLVLFGSVVVVCYGYVLVQEGWLRVKCWRRHRRQSL